MKLHDIFQHFVVDDFLCFYFVKTKAISYDVLHYGNYAHMILDQRFSYARTHLYKYCCFHLIQ